MSFAGLEQSVCGGAPFECYWFQCAALAWRLTSGDVGRTLYGYPYLPEAICCTEATQDQELSSGAITVSLPVDHALARLFRAYLPAQPVSLVLYRGHEGESEVVVGFTGKVASAKFTEVCELTVVPEQDALKRKLPALSYQTQCPRVWGSSGCGVNRDSYLVQATLSSVSGTTVKSSAFATHADGYFSGGWIEKDGALRAILAHVGDTVTLFAALPELEAGGAVLAYPNCQGTEADCRDRFNNLVNYLGFAHIPNKNPFGAGGF